MDIVCMEKERSKKFMEVQRMVKGYEYKVKEITGTDLEEKLDSYLNEMGQYCWRCKSITPCPWTKSIIVVMEADLIV